MCDPRFEAFDLFSKLLEKLIRCFSYVFLSHVLLRGVLSLNFLLECVCIDAKANNCTNYDYPKGNSDFF